MNPDFFSGDDSASIRPSPRKELQGPRPAALKVNKDSHTIKKPPIVPHNHHHQNPPPQSEDRQPVIIYAVSPKVIHTTANDFMTLVQRLTGNTSSAGDMSPAARLASIEKTSPKPSADVPVQPTDVGGTSSTMMDELLRDMEVGGGRLSGILSPAPATLPPISPGFFSPAPSDPFMMGFGNMFVPSPGNMFAPSPSTLFSPSIVSPSSTDYLFNTLFDF